MNNNFNNKAKELNKNLNEDNYNLDDDELNDINYEDLDYDSNAGNNTNKKVNFFPKIVREQLLLHSSRHRQTSVPYSFPSMPPKAEPYS